MSTRHVTARALVLAALVPAAALAPAHAAAQAPATLTDSYTRARAIVDAAIAAHGGLEALRAARQVRVTLEGYDHHRHQSRRVAPPYDSLPYRAELMIDLDRSRLSFERHSSYPGGAHRVVRFVTDGPRGYAISPRAGTHTESQYPPAATQTGNLFYLPQHVLLAAQQAPGALRYVGRLTLAGGAPVEVIAASGPSGLITVAFDPATKRLRAMINVFDDIVAGDAPAEVEFVGYRELSGMLLPTQRVFRVAGEVTQRLNYTAVTPNFSMPDSLAAPPPGSTVAAPIPSIESVRTLAPGVWAVGGAGSNSLVVAFSDHVLVVDAPTFGAADVIARVATLAPGKPIRYVVPTHHHDDHAGGVPHYAAAGATIVGTPGNRRLLERIATARPTLGPAAALPAPRPPRLETITGKRVFTDGTRTVEIHDVGPSPHADEMLVAWIPEEGILFQADLIDVGASGAILPGTNNETTVHFAEWLRARGWPVRVFAGSHGFLDSPAAFEELLRQPITPLLP